MNISHEVAMVRELLGISGEKLASDLGVSIRTVYRWENDRVAISNGAIERFYSYAWSKGIHINNIYEMLLREENASLERKVLFHGSREDFSLPVDLCHSRDRNDFGVGFYLGETYTQAVSYVAYGKSPLVHAFSFDERGLKKTVYNVSLDWMFATALCRGWLDAYSGNSKIHDIFEAINASDIIVSPIADNRMFDIISEFVGGYITDKQCEHALSATNLGMQYVIKSQAALKNLEHLETLYVCTPEREAAKGLRQSLSDESKNKVKVAKLKYRNQGKYIDELLI